MYRNHSTISSNRAGFTLIELMIAVAFVGGLLITITLVIMQIMSLYNKGLTLKEVDGVSRVVVRDMQQGISGSSQFTLQYPERDAAGIEHLTTATTLAEASSKGVDYYNNDAGGRLCTGNYSYVWNTGQAIKATLNPLNGQLIDNPQYKNEDNHGSVSYPVQVLEHHNADGSTKTSAIRFMKKRDPAKAMCQLPPGDTAGTTNFDKIAGDTKDFENMFGSGDNNLMLYMFDISTPSYTSYGQQEGNQITAISTFYSISMVIGTQMGDENSQGLVSTNNATCEAPKDAQMNDSEYCAVNRIDFVARTGSISR